MAVELRKPGPISRSTGSTTKATAGEVADEVRSWGAAPVLLQADLGLTEQA